MIRFRTSIHINRSPAEVFDVLADPTTYPRWNSAVQTVSPLDDEGRYQMRRALPTGEAWNLLEVLDVAPPEEVVIRASDGPTPFTYRYHLSDDGRGTDLSLDADVELGGVFRLAGPLAERAVKSGVDENLATLKRLLEVS